MENLLYCYRKFTHDHLYISQLQVGNPPSLKMLRTLFTLPSDQNVIQSLCSWIFGVRD